MIKLVVVSILALVSLVSLVSIANAQLDLDMIERSTATIRHSTSLLEKQSVITQMCTYATNSMNYDVINACVEYSDKWDASLTQFHTDNKAIMDKILLGALQ